MKKTPKKRDVMKELEKIANRIKSKIFLKKQYREMGKDYVHFSEKMKKTQQFHLQALAFIKAGQSLQKVKEDLESAYFYLNAGRVYAKLDEKNYFYFGAEVFSYELMKCFNESILVFHTNSKWDRCAALCCEFGLLLCNLENFEEAEKYFFRASGYSQRNNHTTSQLFALKESINCLLRIKDLTRTKERLKLLIKVYETKRVAFPKLSLIYLSLFFIYLILGDFENAHKVHANFASCFLGEEKVFIPVLQDLVQCCQLGDVESLQELIKTDLTDLIHDDQKVYLKLLLKKYQDSEKNSTAS